MKYFVANWKMRPQTQSEAKKLYEDSVAVAQTYSDVATIFCPAFIFLPDCVSAIGKNISLGAQDIFWEDEGAYTGEISPAMLKNLGISHVLIGHSERRIHLGETDEMINKKIHAAFRNGITPILLIGEHERNEAREDLLIDQISRSLAGIPSTDVSRMLLCYEPAWAVSSQKDSEIASVEHVQSGIDIIRSILRRMLKLADSEMPPILYGGSVSSADADVLSIPSLDGVVVGSQSMRVETLGALLGILSNPVS